MHATLCLLVLTALAAEPTAPTAPEPSERPAVHQRMADHYLGTTRARAAVLRGDVETAQKEGEKLASLPSDGMPESWRPHLAELAQIGRELGQAPDIDAAGRSIGQLAAVCADCHRTTKGGPKLADPPESPPDWPDDKHMARHLWGAETIWMGILANDDSAVIRGATAIAGGAATNPSPTRDPAILAADDAIHLSATKMVEAPDAGARRLLYGELVAGCGSCHQALEAEGGTP